MDDQASPSAELPPGHRSGYVSIIGRPNVGKSTLLNRILGSKIAAVTPKPQTTRRRLLGIKTRPHAQVLFFDTPGIHQARDLMNQRMVERAVESLREADVVLWLVDATAGVTADDRDIAARLPPPPKTVIVAINKVDAGAKTRVLPVMARVAELAPGRPAIPVSARTGENLETLLAAIEAALPEGPRYYPADEISDEPERAIVGEIVREKAMLETREEIPYSLAVTIDAFEEKPERDLVVIKATLHVARESQKPIVIGQGGHRLKKIGQAARAEIEALLDARVFLELFVRVQEDWPRNLARLREFGL